MPSINMLFVLLACVTSSLNLQVIGTSQHAGVALKEYLFNSSYSKYVRPIANMSETLLTVNTFRPVHLIEMNEKTQTMTTYFTITVRWNDTFLSWLPDDFDGIESITIHQDQIWLPDITFANSVSGTGQLGYDELPVRLYANGSLYTVEWSPTMLVETSCDIDVTYWPFDTQLCGIEIEAQTSSWDELAFGFVLPGWKGWIPDDLVADFYGISTDLYQENSNWILESACLGNPRRFTKIKIPGLIYWLKFRRRTSYYVNTIILPVIFLTVNCPVIFLLPLDCGEKMGYDITVLLAFAVYLSIVSSMLPVTSLTTSILTIYLNLLLALSTVSILITALTLRLNSDQDSQEASPSLKRFVIFFQQMYA